MTGWLFKKINSIPIIGSFFRIVNAYAFSGSIESVLRPAPSRLWWERILKKIVYTLSFVLLLVLVKHFTLPEWSWEPADTILSGFPSILGFGIGVFALMFVMPNEFVKFLRDQRKSLGFGPEMIPADMAYPLLVFVMVMAFAGINKLFPNDFFRFLSAWAFFYGLVMTAELLSFLYISSTMIQRITLKKKKWPIRNRK